MWECVTMNHDCESVFRNCEMKHFVRNEKFTCFLHNRYLYHHTTKVILEVNDAWIKLPRIGCFVTFRCLSFSQLLKISGGSPVPPLPWLLHNLNMMHEASRSYFCIFRYIFLGVLTLEIHVINVRKINKKDLLVKHSTNISKIKVQVYSSPTWHWPGRWPWWPPRACPPPPRPPRSSARSPRAASWWSAAARSSWTPAASPGRCRWCRPPSPPRCCPRTSAAATAAAAAAEAARVARVWAVSASPETFAATRATWSTW